MHEPFVDIVRRAGCAALMLVLAVSPLTGCSRADTSAAGVEDSVRSLAAGGVAVTAEVTSRTPVVALAGPESAMRFTLWQVRNLVAEANAHNGYLGSELDSLGTPPPGVPPFSVLVGAWLTRHQGPLAEYAQRLMGPQDYAHTAGIVFPTMVVLAFIADAARVTTTAAHPAVFDLGPYIAAPAEAPGICTDVSAWVSSVVNSVANALQTSSSSWLGTLWNAVVAVAGSAVSAVAATVLQSLIGFVTRIATIAALVMQVSAMFKPWTVALSAQPSSLLLADAPQGGSFDATLNAQPIAWPPALVDCVNTISGVNLDEASYADAPVRWTKPIGIPGLASVVTEDDTLRADKTAHYAYSTETVPVPADCPRLVSAGALGITVSVERSDISKTITTLERLITNVLPSKMQPYLAPYVQQAFNAATTATKKLGAPHASATMALQENVADPLCIHTPPPGTPTPQPTLHPGARTLPFAQCENLITASDTAPYLDGAVNLNRTMTPEFKRKFINVMKFIVSLGPKETGPTAYRTDQLSMCVIGTPGEPGTIRAVFWSVPAGDAPYHRADPFIVDLDDPNDCRAMFGLDLLNRFDADCVGFNNVVKIEDATAQYGIAALPPIATPTRGALVNVLKSIVQRL